MAVTYANALATRIQGSYLCCTRKEGSLKRELSQEVKYVFLNKRSALDFGRVLRLVKFIKKDRIDLIQAHGTSWFTGVLVKLCVPRVKLVWHDHYGKDLESRKTGLLNSFSRLFDGVISVNSQLYEWTKSNLRSGNLRYFKNFLPNKINEGQDVFLYRETGFNIICVANFRKQKDHLSLLKAIEILQNKNYDVNLHLVGAMEENEYTAEIKKYIEGKMFDKNIYLYGEQENVMGILKQAQLGVLSSISEGLPVALLEYGNAGLPVVCTAVGQCEEVLGEYGKLVPAGNPEALATSIEFYLNNETDRLRDAQNFHKMIRDRYSENAVMPEIVSYLKDITDSKNIET